MREKANAAATTREIGIDMGCLTWRTGEMRSGYPHVALKFLLLVFL